MLLNILYNISQILQLPCGQGVGLHLPINKGLQFNITQRDRGEANKEKHLRQHFLSTKHEKNDIEVHNLKFIKKAPRSLQALIIRNRVEKRFIHLLRTSIPHNLNREDQLHIQAKESLHITQISPIMDQASPHERTNTQPIPTIKPILPTCILVYYVPATPGLPRYYVIHSGVFL